MVIEQGSSLISTLFFQTDNFITNSSSISSILVPMYQDDFLLSHYRQFSPNLTPPHTEYGQSLRFPPIRKVDLRGWPLNSENGKSLLYSDTCITNDVSEWFRIEVARGAWLIERSAWVQRLSIEPPKLGKKWHIKVEYLASSRRLTCGVRNFLWNI